MAKQLRKDVFKYEGPVLEDWALLQKAVIYFFFFINIFMHAVDYGRMLTVFQHTSLEASALLFLQSFIKGFLLMCCVSVAICLKEM